MESRGGGVCVWGMCVGMWGMWLESRRDGVWEVYVLKGLGSCGWEVAVMMCVKWVC